MNSIEALERIKSKYKRCLVQEANRLPFSSDINIENIEEYWHTENKNDFSQIEKDLEVLEILKKHIEINGYTYDEKDQKCIDMLIPESDKDYSKIKEWLEDESR